MRKNECFHFGNGNITELDIHNQNLLCLCLTLDKYVRLNILMMSTGIVSSIDFNPWVKIFYKNVV